MNNIIRILSFDPGLSVCGWAVVDYYQDTGNMLVIKTGLLTPNKIVSRVNMRDQVEEFGKRLMALITLRSMVSRLYEESKPDFVVVEDAFFHPRFPTAYVALVHWITTVKLLIKDNYNKPIFKIPPKLIKQYISGTGDANKKTVQDSIISNSKIRFKNQQILSSLIEHTADAIAISWAFAHENLPTILATK